MRHKPTTRSVGALSARTHFGELIEKAEKQNLRFLVSRRGKPKVVILGIDDYLRNIVKQPEALDQIQVEAQKSGLNTMTEEEINAEIETFRNSKK